MLRFWYLTTVAQRAQAAADAAPTFDAEKKWDAFLGRMTELFPDVVYKWKDLMPDSHAYWFKGKGRGTLRIRHMSQFRRDLALLADIVRTKEFGVARRVRRAIDDSPTWWPAD
jgi:hypothetical protein